MVSKEEVVKVIKRVEKRVQEYKLPITTKVSKSNDPFKVLIATMLSPQTKDTVTGPAFQRLMKLADNPQEMLRLSEKEIEKAIYPVGFYRTKAKRVKQICRILLEKHNGKVPVSMQQLLEFPGVGRKVAGLVMIYGFGKTENIPVDTHCHRVPNRLGWIKTKMPEQTEKELMKLIPKKYLKNFNNTFVTFGQNICTPQKPHCWECPVNKYCKYYKEVYLKNPKKKEK